MESTDVTQVMTIKSQPGGNGGIQGKACIIRVSIGKIFRDSPSMVTDIDQIDVVALKVMKAETKELIAYAIEWEKIKNSISSRSDDAGRWVASHISSLSTDPTHIRLHPDEVVTEL